MALAYFIGHAPQGNFFAPSLNQGEPAVLYCFVFLFFAAAGPGAWSLDSVREKRLAASGDGAQQQRAR
jgi:putative oxidoreductase